MARRAYGLDKAARTWFGLNWSDAALTGRGAVWLTPLKTPLRMNRLAVPVVILLFCACGMKSARADFRLCNNTSGRVSVAISYTDGHDWLSEGWWNLRPSACEVLLRGPLAAQYYYVYAMDERGGEWKGKSFMCTRDREFRIDGRADCFARGFDRTGFFEIDTGRDARNWTVQLTDPAAPVAPATQ